MQEAKDEIQSSPSIINRMYEAVLGRFNKDSDAVRPVK
jgi:hypothetical protein